MVCLRKKIIVIKFDINLIGAIAGKGGFPVPDLRMSHMKNVSCTGSEKSLFQCSYSIVSSSCSPENVAGIICQGMEVLCMPK